MVILLQHKNRMNKKYKNQYKIMYKKTFKLQLRFRKIDSCQKFWFELFSKNFSNGEEEFDSTTLVSRYLISLVNDSRYSAFKLVRWVFNNGNMKQWYTMVYIL